MTNFAHVSTPEDDVKLIFENEPVLFFEDSFTLDKLAVHLKKFTSVTQARKNGFSGPIPRGFEKGRIGKVYFWTWYEKDYAPFVDEDGVTIQKVTASNECMLSRRHQGLVLI